MLHYSVLKKELIAGLNIKDNGIYVDATIGYAGDSKDILKKLKVDETKRTKGITLMALIITILFSYDEKI